MYKVLVPMFCILQMLTFGSLSLDSFFFFLSFYIFSGVGGACATESVWRLEDDFQ